MNTPTEDMAALRMARTADCLARSVLVLREVTDSVVRLAEDLAKLAEALNQDVEAGES